MNLPLPNLDDEHYAEIVEEAIAQIHQEYPEWTDYNPSDTGIILIELLAWITEMTLYRVNQISDANYLSFISLLKGDATSSAPGQAINIQKEIRETLLQLRKRYRAVTTEDYEQLVLEDWNQEQHDQSLKIARAKCIAQCNLDQSDADTLAEGHISLVVVPESPIKLEGLKHYYPLNAIIELEAKKYVIDKLDCKQKGKVFGSPKIVADSDFNACLSFDGSNNYIELPKINFDYSKGFTISIWAYYNNEKKDTRIIDFHNVAYNQYIFLHINREEKLVLDIRYGGDVESYVEKRYVANQTLPNHRWLNLAVTVEEKGIRNIEVNIYVNGAKAECSQSRTSSNSADRHNYIGYSSILAIDKFKGKMARMRMYYRPLKEHEILYNLQQDRTELYKFLEPRKLLTTRLHIVEPEYISVTIKTELVLKEGVAAEQYLEQVKNEVQKFFSPLDSGRYWQGKGYPFGRNVYLSEIYKLLEDLEGVDYVATLEISGNSHNNPNEIELKANQLVNTRLAGFL